jgi:S-adenosylmethionine hydrolase
MLDIEYVDGVIVYDPPIEATAPIWGKNVRDEGRLVFPYANADVEKYAVFVQVGEYITTFDVNSLKFTVKNVHDTKMRVYMKFHDAERSFSDNCGNMVFRFKSHF